MNFDAVIFDLDGTLVHSSPDLHAAAVAMLRDLGRDPVTLEQVTGFIGNGVPKLVERSLRATGGVPEDGGAAALASFSTHYTRDPVRLTRPYPGVMAVLATLDRLGVALGICTNKPETAAHQVLDGVGMAGTRTRPLFDAVVGGDTLTVRKPDPAPVRHALQQLGHGTALYIGDSETDAATAQAAELPFALFTGGYRKTPVTDLPHDFAFDHFDELGDWLATRIARPTA